ncbi:unnamed protein product [Diamesa hyperborea]
MLKEIIFTLLVASCVVAFPQAPRFLDILQNPSELADREGRIVGGRDATIEEFPYMAAMIWSGGFACGGSILNVNTILSAAHCTFGYPASQFQIRVGSNRVSTGGQLVPVTRIINHESYNPNTLIHDICIMKLSRNLVLSASVRTIALPVQGFAVPHGNMATLSGWGGINTAGNRSPTVLQTLQTPIIGNSQCGTINGSPIRADQMCAGGVNGRDSCFGDSGGPLVFQARAVGIVSWGYGDGLCAIGWPSVYVRVSEQLPFITRNFCVVAFPQVPSTFLDLLENPLGPSERDRRIVGGRDATIEEFPYMALMLWQGHQNCGGAILNVNTILSAAHCTFGYPTAQFTVRVGSNRITTGGQVITLARIINHESYNPRTLANDINILKLSRNLVFSASIRAILLPAQGMAIPHGSMATVSGWGTVNTANTRLPTVLQTLQTPVIGNSQCAAINGSPIRANEMCAGAVMGRDACYGDSGGPLVFQARAVGIVSWGRGTDCAIGWPIVYARVSEYLPFITRNFGWLCCRLVVEIVETVQNLIIYFIIYSKAFPQADRNVRIVGGRDATIEEFPFTVALIWFGNHYCGGAILNVNTVVSAAHCTGGRKQTEFAVRAGSTLLSSGGQYIKATEYINHEMYDDFELTYDIAILKLESDLVFSASVRPINLPTATFNVPQDSIATISGWGDLEFRSGQYPDNLRTVQVPVVGNPQCQKIYEDADILPNHICAGEPGRDACQGDSGGPLTYQGRVIGIVSWGYGCAMDWPTVYSRVSEFLPFIVEHS